MDPPYTFEWPWSCILFNGSTVYCVGSHAFSYIRAWVCPPLCPPRRRKSFDGWPSHFFTSPCWLLWYMQSEREPPHLSLAWILKVLIVIKQCKYSRFQYFWTNVSVMPCLWTLHLHCLMESCNKTLLLQLHQVFPALLKRVILCIHYNAQAGNHKR